MKPHTIKVGKFGTSPVSAKVNTIGTKNAAAMIVSNRAIMLKNWIGL
ncbi:hypothetical protein [Eubacterium sp. An11]|nr:hypothetical protein [Eubacterium sp. An11]